MDSLSELQKWFIAHCDGDWEHTYGIDIHTVDNPGWSVTIEFGETTLEDIPFAPVDVERSETDNYSCSVHDGKFRGVGGAGNLGEIIEVFLRWARHEDDQPSAPS